MFCGVGSYFGLLEEVGGSFSWACLLCLVWILYLSQFWWSCLFQLAVPIWTLPSRGVSSESGKAAPHGASFCSSRTPDSNKHYCCLCSFGYSLNGIVLITCRSRTPHWTVSTLFIQRFTFIFLLLLTFPLVLEPYSNKNATRYSLLRCRSSTRRC